MHPYGFNGVSLFDGIFTSVALAMLSNEINALPLRSMAMVATREPHHHANFRKRDCLVSPVPVI
jgi:hypothetical protein